MADDKDQTIPYLSSFVTAGERYSIDPMLLVAVATVESNFDQSARNVNVDGSVDVGIMQINRKYWEGRLKELNIRWEEVERSPELNINVGAWVLSQKFQHWGVSWKAIGAYNAGFTDKNKAARTRYARKVYRVLKDLNASRDWVTAANTHVSLLADANH